MKVIFTITIISLFVGLIIPAMGETISSSNQHNSFSNIHDIECKSHLSLIFKDKVWTPACVKPSTVDKLIERGWAADKVTTHMMMNTFSDSSKTLIVLSAPSVNEPYYEDVFEDIIDYDISAVNKMYGKDKVILLADSDTMPYLEGKVPEDTLVQADVADIWIRDFGTILTNTQVKFDYKPQYLEVEDADWIDGSFENWFTSTGQSTKRTDLILDGGNFVFNGVDKAVTTVRVFGDNPQYTETKIDTMLKELLEINEIAYLPEEEGDITGHSDGMVMWVSETKLLVNEYDEPFRTLVLDELGKLPNIEIIEIPYVQDPGLWADDWPSACGYYVNSLVTDNYIYVPTYGFEEDEQVLYLIQSHTDKEVVDIDASNVCFMGGSVRCLTWTIHDEASVNLN